MKAKLPGAGMIQTYVLLQPALITELAKPSGNKWLEKTRAEDWKEIQ